MKFEEFKSLIEERRKLIKFADEKKIFLRIQEIDSKIIPEQFESYKGLSRDVYFQCTKSVLNRMFEVGKEIVVSILEDYFKNKAEVLLNKNDNSLWIEVKNGEETKVYSLGKYNDTLYCLCGFEIRDWTALLKDYSNLRDFIWDKFKELKQQEKRNQISLIERMIQEKNNEQAIYEIPHLREMKIAEIKKEKRELEGMRTLIKNSYEDINV